MKYLLLLTLLFFIKPVYSQIIPPQNTPGAVLNHEINYRLYYQNQINHIPSYSLDQPETSIYIEENALPSESSAYGLLKVPNSDKIFIIGPEY